MTRIPSIRGAPRTIRVDNGPEVISKALDRWAYENLVTLDFSRPGKALLSLSKGRPTKLSSRASMVVLRDECLNAHWFLSLAHTRT
jgi:putative transposase